HLQRRRLEADAGGAKLVIPAEIAEGGAVGPQQRLEVGSRYRTLHAPHLENVQEVAGVVKLDGERDRLQAVVVEIETVEELVGQQLLAVNVDGVFGQVEVLPHHDVGGGELDLRQDVLLAGRRQH